MRALAVYYCGPISIPKACVEFDIFFSSEPGFLGVSSVFHLQQKLTQIPTWAAKIEYTGIGTMWLPEPNSIYHISFIIYYFRDSWVKLHEVNTC